MAKKDLKHALGAILDKAYSGGPMADAASQMSDLSALASTSPVAGGSIAQEVPDHRPEIVLPGPPLTETADMVDIQLATPGEPSFHPSITTSIHPPEPAIHPCVQPAIHASIQSTNHPSIHPASQPSVHGTARPSIHPFDERKVYQPLTPGQGKVLLYLAEKCAGATNVEVISAETQIPVGTVKDGLRALLKYGYIVNKWRIVQHDFHGFGFSLNHQMCIEYAAKVNSTSQPSIHPSLKLMPHPSTRPSIHPIIQPSVPFSSSSKDIKTTTMFLPQPEPETLGDIIATDPELEWWFKKGLTVVQAETWAKAAKAPEASLLQSLRHFAYDMVENGREAEMKKDPSNYFFSVIKRSGKYDAPPGYKSASQKILEYETQLLEQQQAEIQQLRQVRQQREEATLELAFQKLLSDTGCPEYQELLDGLSNFERSSKGRVLEIGLRRVFRVKNGYPEEG